MKGYIRPTIARKPDWLFFTMGQKSKQNPLDIADQIINFANSIKRSGTEVSILSLVPCGD